MAANERVVREVVGDSMFVLCCDGEEFVFLKPSLSNESPFFKKELENFPTRKKMFLDWHNPNIVKNFEIFVSKKKKPLVFKNLQDFEDGLKFCFKYETKAFYDELAKKNILRFLNASTILTFVTIGYENEKDFYTHDLFHAIQERFNSYGKSFNRVMVADGDAKQLKYYLSNLKPFESRRTMTMILDWVKTNPTVRAEFVLEMIDLLRLSKMDYSQIKFLYLELLRYVDKNPLWTAIVERMMIEQTSLFVMYKEAIDTHRLDDVGRIRKDQSFGWSFSVMGEIKTVFHYLDTMYFVTAIQLSDSMKELLILKWRRSQPILWKHTITLVHKSNEVYVSAVGPLVFVAVVDEPCEPNAGQHEAFLIKLDVNRPRSSQTIERLITPFLINEIKCCRTYVYFLSYNSDSNLYDGILRINLSLTFKLLMPLDGYRQPDRKWECAAICQDRLHIFAFDSIGSDTPGRPLRMVSYADYTERGEWSAKEMEVPWRKFNKTLNFYDKYQLDDDIERYCYRFVNFLADNSLMYQYNPQTQKFISHTHSVDPEMPKENYIITMMRKRR